MTNRKLPTIEQVLQSDCASYWLQDALRTAIDRDAVDAINDAELLVEMLRARL